MTYWVNGTVEELELMIPEEDLPLKSDVIVGFKYPVIVYPEDEGYDNQFQPKKVGNLFIFKVSKEQSNWISTRECSCSFMEELAKWCVKYKGTLVAKEHGEEGDVEYIRVIKGIRKKVKLVEVEE